MSFRIRIQWFFLILAVSIPFVIMFIRNNIVDFLMLEADASEGGFGQSIYFGQRYLDSGSNSSGIAFRIATVLGAIPYYMLLVQSVLLTIKSVEFTEMEVVQSFSRLFIIMVLIASLFLFNFGVDASLLYVRFLRFAAFPSAVLMAYYWEYEYYPKLTRWTFYMAALATLYSVSYALYCLI